MFVKEIIKKKSMYTSILYNLYNIFCDLYKLIYVCDKCAFLYVLPD